jgi:hypothetical protein
VAKNDFNNKMPAKLHFYFGHSCVLVFISSFVKAKKKGSKGTIGN